MGKLLMKSLVEEMEELMVVWGGDLDSRCVQQ